MRLAPGLLSLCCLACGGAGLSPDAGPGQDGGTSDAGAFPGCDAGVTFQQVLSQNLSSCGSSSGGILRGCHQVSPPAGGLDLQPAAVWPSLVGAPASGAASKLRVVPGNPLRSFLYQKLTDTQAGSEGDPMPKGEGLIWQPPPEADLALLRCWIDRGAPND